MHSVQRSPEPGFLARLRSANTRWQDLGVEDRRGIRDALKEDFQAICAYCERPCESPDSTGALADAETIDHFRPRNHFPALRFDWMNLVYACQRCNKKKDDSWPGYDDESTEERLASEYPRYLPVTEYVSPNAIAGQRTSEEFFNFDFLTGEIVPAGRLNPLEWSMALRTIHDIDLNDEDIEEFDPDHLLNRRLTQRDLLFMKLNELGDFKVQAQIMRDFTRADRPYSTFVAAYVISRWPELGQLFPED